MKFFHHLYANLFGYFWVPCILCNEYFGGHQWRDIEGKSSTIWWNGSKRVGICPSCTRKGWDNEG